MKMWQRGNEIGVLRTYGALTVVAVLFFWNGHLTAADKLPSAQRLLLGGKYEEAAETFSEILGSSHEDSQALSPTRRATAARGLARCMASRGKNTEARRILEDSRAKLKDAPSQKARLHAELALLAVERGDHEAAEIHVEAAIKLDEKELLARLLRADLLRMEGRIDESHRAYAWLVKFHNNEQNDTFADVESLRRIGLAAARLAEWNHNADDFKFLVSELYPAAVKVDKYFWPANYELGRLFAKKHNRADAARAFAAALAVNPHAAEVHAAVARLALSNRDVKKARESADLAIDINPRLVAAWHVRADLLWANFDVRGARKLLAEQVLPLNPRDEETLGRLAACYVMLDLSADSKDEDSIDAKQLFTQLIEEVDARNPRAADFYFQLGQWLQERHKYPRASCYYLEAQKRMPRKTGPAAALGMIDMGAGREDEAKKLLTAAAVADPFNVRIANTLELFQVIESLETDACDEYMLRYDARRDALLGRYAKRYMAEVYPQLCKQFGYRPPQAPLVEIFNVARGQNGQQWFGVRMTGLPYVGTVAACSGRVVAMTSPGDPSIGGKFNWARVLKHELIHVVTLQQTSFNIPHWFTEGLAVRGEDNPRPYDWNEMICRRVKSGKLFTLDTINFGFTRPGASGDRKMAYCQAELYVDYIIERHGESTITGLLDAYSEGRSTDQAIEQVLGVSQKEFEAGFREYIKGVAKKVSGLPGSEPLPPLDELQKRYRENLAADKPLDVDLAAQLALAHLRRDMKAEAVELAAKVQSIQPKHPLGSYVLARLALGVSRTDSAEHLLQNALNREQPHPLVLDLLADLKVKGDQYKAAIELYRLAHHHEPLNPRWLRRLALVYLLMKNESELAETLAKIAQLDTDDDTVRIKLALIAIGREDYKVATRWAREAIFIDVLNPTAHKAFAEALAGRHNYKMAIEEFETAVGLDPKDLSLRHDLAATCLKSGDIAKARRVMDELLEVAPDDPVTGQLRQRLNELKKKEEQ